MMIIRKGKKDCNIYVTIERRGFMRVTKCFLIIFIQERFDASGKGKGKEGRVDPQVIFLHTSPTYFFCVKIHEQASYPTFKNKIHIFLLSPMGM